MANPTAPPWSTFPPITSDGIVLLWLKAIPLVPEIPLSHAISSAIPLFLFLLSQIFTFHCSIPISVQTKLSFLPTKNHEQNLSLILYSPSSCSLCICSSLLQSYFKIFLYLLPSIYSHFS